MHRSESCISGGDKYAPAAVYGFMQDCEYDGFIEWQLTLDFRNCRFSEVSEELQVIIRPQNNVYFPSARIDADKIAPTMYKIEATLTVSG
jgi:hypothetical protein